MAGIVSSWRIILPLFGDFNIVWFAKFSQECGVLFSGGSLSS